MSLRTEESVLRVASSRMVSIVSSAGRTDVGTDAAEGSDETAGTRGCVGR